MRRDDKERMVAELQEAVDAADSLIISAYRGLTVKQITALRRTIAEAGGRMRVVKKTLLRRALEGRSEEAIGEYLEGPIAVTFASGDAVAVLKNMSAFARDHEQLLFTGGWIDGQPIDGGQLVELASLPPRDELLAQLLAAMQGPLVQLVGVLQAIPRDLVLTLQALAQKRAADEGAAA